MNKFLQKIYDQEPLYMPYNMKKKLPKVVAKAILKQNKLIADIFVVVLMGVSREVMVELRKTLKKDVAGFIGVSDMYQTDKNGRWRVLVKEQTFKKTRKFISENLGTWINKYPPAIHDTTPDHYPTPQVHQKYAEDDNDESSGQAS